MWRLLEAPSTDAVTFSASDHAGAQTTPNRTPAIPLEDHLNTPKGAA